MLAATEDNTTHTPAPLSSASMTAAANLLGQTSSLATFHIILDGASTVMNLMTLLIIHN